MTHKQYLAVKDKLTVDLAKALYDKLVDMGEDVRGIEWFNPYAASYHKNIVDTPTIYSV